MKKITQPYQKQRRATIWSLFSVSETVPQLILIQAYEMSMKLNPKKVEYLTADGWFKFLRHCLPAASDLPRRQFIEQIKKCLHFVITSFLNITHEYRDYDSN